MSQEQQQQEPPPNYYKTERPYVSGRCLEGALQVSGQYQDCVWCLEVLRVSGRGLEGVWIVSGQAKLGEVSWDGSSQDRSSQN